jgi:hypothetical protein
MKKLYSALLSSVLTLSALTASATNVDVTITCNHSDAVIIRYYDGSTTIQTTLNEGENTFSIPEYNSVSVGTTSSDYLLTSMTSSEVSPYLSSTSYGSFYISDASSYPNGVNVNIVAKTLAEAYDATITLTVDDPSKVSAQFAGTYRDALTGLESNTPTEVSYISSTESQLYISSKDSSISLYQVKQNGQVLTPTYGRYTVSLTSGDNIEISADYPDADSNVAITYSEKGAGYLTGVAVNGTALESDFANGFSAKLGDKVEFTFDNTNYKFNSLSINGTNQSYYGYGTYSFQLTAEETNVYIDATKYETFSATINVDDPARVTVTRPSGYSSETLSLQAGDNTMEFVAGQNTSLTISPATDCYLVSVSDGTNEYFTSGSSYCNVTITEGMTLTITSGAVARDKKIVLYIDSTDQLSYKYLQRVNTRVNVTIDGTYTIVPFDDADNPFQLACYGNGLDGHLYINGESVTAYGSGDTYANFYPLNFADGDIVKLYPFGEPATYNVSFEVANDIQTYFTVTTDLISAVENYTAGFSSMAGTQVDIATAVENATVSVNGENIAATNGVYTFNVNADSTVKLDAGQSGVESVSVTSNLNENGAVYNLQGVKVLNSASDMNKLAAGIYIVNGKKVLVK